MKTAKVYKMNECDWWCDYSVQKAKKNYVEFVGTDSDTQDWKKYPPEELTEKELNKYKFKPEEPEAATISFKEELQKRIDNKDVPSFFASTEF